MNVKTLKKELQAYPPESELKIVVVGNKACIQIQDRILNPIIIVDQNFKA